MPPSENKTKRSKFTRGEKCLFTHLIITFVFIILMVIVYFVHLCLVEHTRDEVFRIYRRTYTNVSGLSLSDFQCIGVMYLNETPATIICNTLLLSARWSLAPGQCTSMRDDPDLSNYLFKWTIKYRIDGKNIQSLIKKSLTHSYFNRGDFISNIGLFEHVEPIHKSEYYVAPRNIILNDTVFEKYEKLMFLVDWEIDFSKKGDISSAVVNRLRPIFSRKCAFYTNPIVEKIRDYEFCVTFEELGPVADHGAMFVMNSKIIGFFSWGDLSGRGLMVTVPCPGRYLIYHVNPNHKHLMAPAIPRYQDVVLICQTFFPNYIEVDLRFKGPMLQLDNYCY